MSICPPYAPFFGFAGVASAVSLTRFLNCGFPESLADRVSTGMQMILSSACSYPFHLSLWSADSSSRLVVDLIAVVVVVL